MTSPTVSILVPAYNAERHVLVTIEKALTQRGVDVEVIVRDDGSADSTVQRLETFGSRIRLLRGKNVGPAVGRNELFTYARGEFVHFLDADDTMAEDFCAAAVGALERNSAAAFAACGAEFLREFEKVPTGDNGVAQIREDPMLYVLRSPIHLGACLYRRSALAILIGPFDHTYCWAEDWELNLRLLAAGRKIEIVDRILKTYAVCADSFSRDSIRCARAVALMLVHYANPRRLPGLDRHADWARVMGEHLIVLADRLCEVGDWQSASAAWRTAEQVWPAYRFNNRWLDRVASVVGLAPAFFLVTVKRRFSGEETRMAPYARAAIARALGRTADTSGGGDA